MSGTLKVNERYAGSPAEMRRLATRLKPDGQPARLLRYLRDHPGVSSLEITQALYVVNVTGRVSDLRAAGYNVVCRRRPDGADGYVVVEPKRVDRGVQVEAFR